MNKEIRLKNDAIVLFFANIVMIIIIFIMRYICGIIGVSNFVKNLISIINILILLLGIYFNIVVYKEKINDNVRKNIILTVCLVLAIILQEVSGVFIINKITLSKYSKVTDEIVNYCRQQKCDKYETIKKDKYLDFKITNKYLDSNEKSNYYEIHNICTTSEVVQINIIVYSDKDSYSEDLIVRLTSDYLKQYNTEISTTALGKAFEKRLLNDKEIEGNVTYLVTEKYNKSNKLLGLITTIEIRLEWYFTE